LAILTPPNAKHLPLVMMTNSAERYKVKGCLAKVDAN
jgi:hypothetical protein